MQNHEGCFVCFKLCSCNSKPCIQLDLDVWVSFFIAIHQRFYRVNNRTAKYDKHIKVSEGLWTSKNIITISYNNSTVTTVCWHCYKLPSLGDCSSLPMCMVLKEKFKGFPEWAIFSNVAIYYPQYPSSNFKN